MSYCPSQDWDRYCQQMDEAEECYICKKPNWNEDTEEVVFPEDPSFCSAECRDKYEVMEKEAAEAEAEMYEQEKKWEAEQAELRKQEK